MNNRLKIKTKTMDLLYSSIFILLPIGIFGSSITDIHISKPAPIRTGEMAHLKCIFYGDNFTLQYITWIRYDIYKKRSFVYEYSLIPPYNQAYNDLEGRAFLNLTLNKTPEKVSPLPESKYTGEPNGSAPEGNMNGEILENPPDSKLTIPRSRLSKNQADTNEKDNLVIQPADATAKSDNTPTDTAQRSTTNAIKPTIETLRENAILKDMEEAMILDTGEPRAMRLNGKPNGDKNTELEEPTGTKHWAVLYVKDLRLSDEGNYDCLVKPVGEPGVAALQKLTVKVPPTKPRIRPMPQSQEGDNITLRCEGNVGKPSGKLKWYRKRRNGYGFETIANNKYRSKYTLNPNKTVTATSTLTMQVLSDDDASIVKCVAENAVLYPGEEKPSHELPLNVQYPPYGGKILFDRRAKMYFCQARGNPMPTFTWQLIRNNSPITVGTDKYLNTSAIAEIKNTGFYDFKCIAQNLVKGLRREISLTTNLYVQNFPGFVKRATVTSVVPSTISTMTHKSTRAPTAIPSTQKSRVTVIFRGSPRGGRIADVRKVDRDREIKTGGEHKETTFGQTQTEAETHSSTWSEEFGKGKYTTRGRMGPNSSFKPISTKLPSPTNHMTSKPQTTITTRAPTTRNSPTTPSTTDMQFKTKSPAIDQISRRVGTQKLNKQPKGQFVSMDNANHHDEYEWDSPLYDANPDWDFQPIPYGAWLDQDKHQQDQYYQENNENEIADYGFHKGGRNKPYFDQAYPPFGPYGSDGKRRGGRISPNASNRQLPLSTKNEFESRKPYDPYYAKESSHNKADDKKLPANPYEHHKYRPETLRPNQQKSHQNGQRYDNLENKAIENPVNNKKSADIVPHPYEHHKYRPETFEPNQQKSPQNAPRYDNPEDQVTESTVKNRNTPGIPSHPYEHHKYRAETFEPNQQKSPQYTPRYESPESQALENPVNNKNSNEKPPQQYDHYKYRPETFEPSRNGNPPKHAIESSMNNEENDFQPHQYDHYKSRPEAPETDSVKNRPKHPYDNHKYIPKPNNPIPTYNKTYIGKNQQIFDGRSIVRGDDKRDDGDLSKNREPFGSFDRNRFNAPSEYGLPNNHTRIHQRQQLNLNKHQQPILPKYIDEVEYDYPTYNDMGYPVYDDNQWTDVKQGFNDRRDFNKYNQNHRPRSHVHPSRTQMDGEGRQIYNHSPRKETKPVTDAKRTPDAQKAFDSSSFETEQRRPNVRKDPENNNQISADKLNRFKAYVKAIDSFTQKVVPPATTTEPVTTVAPVTITTTESIASTKAKAIISKFLKLKPKARIGKHYIKPSTTTKVSPTTTTTATPIPTTTIKTGVFFPKINDFTKTATRDEVEVKNRVENDDRPTTKKVLRRKQLVNLKRTRIMEGERETRLYRSSTTAKPVTISPEDVTLTTPKHNFDPGLGKVQFVGSREFDCSRKLDGVYGSGCRVFYRCYGNKAYKVRCTSPNVLNSNSGTCDSPAKAPAPCGVWRDCGEKQNQKYADEARNCQYYYTCWHGFFLGHNKCNPGLVFNEKIQVCDWPESAPAPCGKDGEFRGKFG